MAETGQMNTVTITRIFDALRERVWQAWTDPEQLMRWWGPKDFTSPTCKIDLRVGGKYLYCMEDQTGKQYWGTGTYEEIVPFDKLVYTDSFADENGNIVPATHYGMPEDIPMELQVTVTFEDFEGKTRMTLTHVGMPAGAMADDMTTGWNQSFDKLAETLVSKTDFVVDKEKLEVRMTRIFDAPRERLWEAMTDADQVVRWWGPSYLTTTVEKDDVQVGGRWRYIQRDKDGNEYAFRGEYQEVVKPERIIRTFEYEPMAGHILTETMGLEELPDGRTKFASVSKYANIEDLEGMVQSGMEGGARESMDRLAALAEKA